MVFLRKVITWWTIINVKNKGIDSRNRQPLQAVMSDPNDHRLCYIQQFGDMCLNMAGRQSKRIRQLSNYTASAIHHTYYGLHGGSDKASPSWKSYDYVCLAEFSTDTETDWKNHLVSCVRQGSGGAYFINAQQVTEKLRICQAKLHLMLNCDFNITPVSIKHEFPNCNYSMDEVACNVIDTLPELEKGIGKEVNMSIFHIAGHVIRKVDVEETNDDTYYYRKKYGRYTISLDRGGLATLKDTVWQSAVFSFIMFEVIKHNVCRAKLMRVFQQISDYYGFNMQKCRCKTLANIFINKYCKLFTPLFS